MSQLQASRPAGAPWTAAKAALTPVLARTAEAKRPKAMLHVVRKVALGDVGSPLSGKSDGSAMAESAGLISCTSSTRPGGG